MERELVAIFFISETKRDFDQVQQNHFNSLKKLVDFQNLKGVAQILEINQYFEAVKMVLPNLVKISFSF